MVGLKYGQRLSEHHEMSTNIIETNRLYLRNFVETDFAAMHAYGSINNFAQYELWEPNIEPYGLKFIQKAIADATYLPRNSYDMAIILKSIETLIGHAHLAQDLENGQIGNVGYSINPKFQDQGFATEICTTLIAYGINQLRLTKLYATCDTRNMASVRVLEKSGMHRVAHMIGDRQISGKIYNSYRYEIDAQQWSQT